MVRRGVAGGIRSSASEGGHMGWGRFLLLGDVGQQCDLGEQRAGWERLKHSLRAEGRSESAGAERARLRAENGELKLYLAVLFRLLVAKGAATADEVRSLVRVVDESDGRADGTFQGDVVSG